MQKFAVLAAMVAVTFSLTGSAYAQQPPAGKQPGAGKGRYDKRIQGMERMAKELGLSEAQQTKVKALRERTQAKVQPIATDSNLTNEQKREKIRPILKAAEQEFNTILTPEQRVKYKKMQQEAAEKRKARQANGGAPAGNKP